MKQKTKRIKLSPKEYYLLKLRVFERDKYRCKIPWCKSSMQLEAHHVKKRSQGGSDCLENLVTVCHTHHAQIEKHQIVVIGTNCNLTLHFVLKNI